jgi:hypothetical protein
MAKGSLRDTPCWCGSNRKLKKCHGAVTFEATNRAVLPDGTIVNVDRVEAVVPVMKMFPLPVDLFELARWARDQAASPGADHRATVMCVLLTAAAAEGIVNSLLEPLVPREEWQDPSGRDVGLNWARVPKKWIKLSEKLKMRPQLDVEKLPLKALLEVFDIRNKVLHYNLRPNIEEVVVPMKATYDRGHVSITDDPMVDARALVEADFGLKAALHPGRASGYYAAVVNVLREVLPYCTPDPFGLIAALTRLAKEEPATTTTADEGG